MVHEIKVLERPQIGQKDENLSYDVLREGRDKSQVGTGDEMLRLRGGAGDDDIKVHSPGGRPYVIPSGYSGGLQFLSSEANSSRIKEHKLTGTDISRFKSGERDTGHCWTLRDPKENYHTLIDPQGHIHKVSKEQGESAKFLKTPEADGLSTDSLKRLLLGTSRATKTGWTLAEVPAQGESSGAGQRGSEEETLPQGFDETDWWNNKNVWEQ